MGTQNPSDPPRGQQSAGDTSEAKFVWPTSPKAAINQGFQGAGSDHEGVDIALGCGNDMIAVADGTCSGVFSDPPGYGTYFEIDHGNGITTRYAHGPNKIEQGDTVTQGDVVGAIGQEGNSTGCHLHFEVHENGVPVDPAPYLDGAKTVKGDPSQTIDPVGSPGSAGSVESIAKAAALSTFLNFPGLELSAESQALKGVRSLMNDQPVLPFIQQICSASLREFQSMPNGNFYAFYPDYFGGLGHRTPYWEIRDIEILDGQINLSDDALATHVYVVGDSIFDREVNMQDRINSTGNVTVLTAFMADFLNGVTSPVLKKDPPKDIKKAKKEYERELKNIPTLAAEGQAVSFLKKYGARPYYEEAPYVRAPFFEKFLAYERFCMLWAQQFLTSFTFTFMPELFPGGIVKFPDHGIQCYIEEVVHECSYESGFVTRANLSAPSSIRGKDGKPTDPQVHAGMIRAAILSVTPSDEQGTSD